MSTIPNSWTRLAIGEAGKWCGGGTPSKSVDGYWIGGHVPWVSPKDMKTTRIHDTEDHITERAIKESATKWVTKGSVLVVTRSGILVHTLPVAVTEADVTVNQDLKALTPAAGVESDFVAWALRSAAPEILKTCTKNGTTVASIEFRQLCRHQIPLAPSPEQRRIVEALDSYLTRLDAATEGLKRVEANLKRYRASVLKAAVEGNLVPTEAELAKKEKREFEPASVLLERILKERRHRWEQAELVKMKTKGEVPRNDTWKDKYEEPSAPDTSELPELPEGWCWTSLDQLSLSVRNGISTPPNETDGVPILRISAVRALSLNLEDIRYLPNNPTAYQGFELEIGDLLFTRYNGNPALVGACARVPEGAGGIYYPDKLIRVRPVSGTLVCSEFAELAAAAGASRDHLSRWTKTTAGQAGISGADVKKMPLPFAPLLEQERVADAVSDAWSVASNASHSVAVNLAHLTRLRQSILRWAFEGKLVDQNPKDEPASVLLERIRGERESSQPVKPPKPERARRKSA